MQRRTKKQMEEARQAMPNPLADSSETAPKRRRGRQKKTVMNSPFTSNQPEVTTSNSFMLAVSPNSISINIKR